MSPAAWLSAKPIDPAQRLIVALDVATASEALDLVDVLGPHAGFYKIGMELLTSGDFFGLLRQLHDQGKQVFVDLKFFDVPATVASAVRGLARHPATFCTIHGNDAMMRAAAQVKGGLKLLAVTALTSLDQGDLDDLGFRCDARSLVLSRARAALAAGCDGVVSSGLEAADLRAELDHRLLVVCPGIRPVANSDDQKRTVDVRQAFENGADYIVVGRPIRDAADPRQAAADIQATIAGVFGERGGARVD
jgi:orotidine-5'-phosphate decarboxylase